MVGPDADALDAVRLLVQHRMPGITVINTAGQVHSVLPASEVLRLLLPCYTLTDPRSHARSTTTSHLLDRLLPQPDREE